MLENGTVVKIHLIGTLDSGEEFENSVKRNSPQMLTIGDGSTLPSLEDIIRSLEIGARKTVRIPVADAFGERSDELIEEIDRDLISNPEQLPVGHYIEVVTPSGPATVGIAGLTEDKVLFDYNHPLAGQNLNYTVELIDAYIPEAAIGN